MIENRPAEVNDIGAQILPASLVLFQGLKRAYEGRKFVIAACNNPCPRHVMRIFQLIHIWSDFICVKITFVKSTTADTNI